MSKFTLPLNDVIHIVANIIGDNYSIYYSARWLEDEFIICLDFLELDQAIRDATKIEKQVRNYSWESVLPGLYVSGTLGVAQLKGNEDEKDLILRAILGCVEAKREGKYHVRRGPEHIPNNISHYLGDYSS